jgi:hypothetical protein
MSNNEQSKDEQYINNISNIIAKSINSNRSLATKFKEPLPASHLFTDEEIDILSNVKPYELNAFEHPYPLWLRIKERIKQVISPPSKNKIVRRTKYQQKIDEFHAYLRGKDKIRVKNMNQDE